MASYLSKVRVTQRSSSFWIHNYHSNTREYLLTENNPLGHSCTWWCNFLNCKLCLLYDIRLVNMSTLTLPDSIKGRLCGAPLSTSLTLQKHRLDYFIHLITAFLDWKVFSCFFGHFQRWSERYLYPDFLACHGGGTSCQHTLCRGQDRSFPERHREWVHRGNTSQHSDVSGSCWFVIPADRRPS